MRFPPRRAVGFRWLHLSTTFSGTSRRALRTTAPMYFYFLKRLLRPFVTLSAPSSVRAFRDRRGRVNGQHATALKAQSQRATVFYTFGDATNDDSVSLGLETETLRSIIDAPLVQDRAKTLPCERS